MTMTLPQLRNLPKIDLHRHLDCSMRWSTVTEIAKSLKMKLGAQPALSRDSFLITNKMNDLESVLKKFLCTQKVLASEEILTRLAFEVCEDAYNDNIAMLELRYAPSFINEGHSQLTYNKIHKSLMKGIQLAEKKYGITVGLIGIIQRIKSLAEAEKAMDFFIDHKKDYIAVDLADNEEGFDPKPFAPLFQKAKKAGLHITIHSGETPSAQAGQWIIDSIELLGAERIGHGVQSIKHPHVIKILKSRNIPLEICPLSNWLTQAFSSFETHPLKKLYDSGVLVTLNSDDPGIFGSTLTDDYDIAQKYHGFGVEEFKKMNKIAFQKSFIPEKRKKPWENVFT
jgi:adenosine deaminase